jgi:hypothetical protein
MTALKILKENNQIEHHKFKDLMNVIFESLLIKTVDVDSIYILKQKKVNNQFAVFLEQFVESGFIDSKQSKLEFINFIDKLNMQKELLEIESKAVNLKDIKIAANRLGKKSQSAFESK